MKGLWRILAIIFLLNVWISPGFAQNETWSDRYFDFTSVKAVYLYEPTYPAAMTEEIVRLKTRDIYYEATAKLKKKEVLTQNELEKKMLRYLVIDYPALVAKDEQRAAEVWQQALPKLADLAVRPVIEQYEVQKTWKKPYTYTTTKYEEITIDKDGKKTKITVPRTVENYVEGRNIYTAYIKVRFDAYDTKTDQLVFSYVDDRVAQKDLIDMYKRIVDSFYGKFSKTLK